LTAKRAVNRCSPLSSGNAMSLMYLSPWGGGSAEGLEGDQGEGVLHPRKGLDGVGHEVTDVHSVGKIALHQQIVLARDRIDFRHLLDREHRLVGDLVGLAEIALHLNEDRLHGLSGTVVVAPSDARPKGLQLS